LHFWIQFINTGLKNIIIKFENKHEQQMQLFY